MAFTTFSKSDINIHVPPSVVKKLQDSGIAISETVKHRPRLLYYEQYCYSVAANCLFVVDSSISTEILSTEDIIAASILPTAESRQVYVLGCLE